MDKLTKEQRKKNMQAVKSMGTKIELVLGKSLKNIGLSYIKNDKTVLGKPDFTFKKQKIAVFCDSEFWHGKDWETRKYDHKTNQEFWIKKIERNRQRDEEVTAELEKQGWIVLRFWGKTILKSSENCALKIKHSMNRKKPILFKNNFTVNEILDKYSLKIEDNKEAAFTHYLHNSKNGVKKYFKRDALNYTKKLLTKEFPKKIISFDVAEIIRRKQPKAFFLENVKGFGVP